MTSQVDFKTQSPDSFNSLIAFSEVTAKGALEEKTRDLVAIRTSQLNGCAFCFDMHIKDARMHGESELRLYHLSFWHESPLFSARERAALAWTDALTKRSNDCIPDELYDCVREQLSEKEISDLTFFISSVTAWNLLNIGFKSVPGSCDDAFGFKPGFLN